MTENAQQRRDLRKKKTYEVFTTHDERAGSPITVKHMIQTAESILKNFL